VVAVAGTDILGSAGYDAALLKAELSNHSGQERGSALSRFDQNDAQVWAKDLDRYAGDSGPGSEIRYRNRARRKQLQEQETVQDDVLDEPSRFD